VQCRCLGAVVEAERCSAIAQDLFVGRDDTSHAVHGIDDLGGFVTHSGGILPDDCFEDEKPRFFLRGGWFGFERHYAKLLAHVRGYPDGHT